MKNPYFLALLLAALIIFQWKEASSQPADTLQNPKRQTSIQQLNDRINVKFSLSNNVETFAVHTKGDNYDLYPNTRNIASLGVSYRFISFSVKFAPKFIPGNNDDDLKGKTSVTGLGAEMHFVHWFQQLSYSRTKGYYLHNTSELDPGWTPGQPYLQAPDLVSKIFEGATGYSFNPAFSFKALTTQTERQLKSAGSFIPLLSYRYYIVDNKATTGTTQKSNNFEAILGAGYYYTLVLKHSFYLSAGAIPGAGLIYTKLTTRYPTGDVKQNSHSPIVRLNAHVALGYNGEKFFAGVYANGFASSYRQQNTTAVNYNNRLTYQVFVGYRFNVPKSVREKYQQLMPKVVQ